MTEEKKIILEKIDYLITKRKAELLKGLPSIHEIEDGIIIRFFTDWDNCDDDDKIKYKKIINVDKPDESVVFFYIPRDSKFQLKQRFFIGDMTCLEGKMEVTADNKTRLLEGQSKMSVDSDEVIGKAIKNTYVLTTSNRRTWSKTTQEYVAANK